MAILEVRTPDGQPSPRSKLTTAAPATATLTQTDPEHVAIAVDATAPTSASIAIAWSPRWHISVDGRPQPTLATADHLLGVQLPAGTSRIELEYGPDGADALGRLVTVVTAGCAGYVLWAGRRRRRADPVAD